jgi:hypothetical protein
MINFYNKKINNYISLFNILQTIIIIIIVILIIRNKTIGVEISQLFNYMLDIIDNTLDIVDFVLEVFKHSITPQIIHCDSTEIT